MAGKAQAYDIAIREYATQRGLSEPEINQIVQGAVRAGIVPVTEAKYTQTNPITGQPIAMADPYQVVFESLDYALWQDQALYQSVAARQHAQQTAPTAPTAPVSPAPGVAAPVPPHQQAPVYPGTQPPAGVPTVNGAASATPAQPTTPSYLDPILAKKAQAASMATAPSANASLPPVDPRTMTREQTANAMAGDIARYWAGQ